MKGGWLLRIYDFGMSLFWFIISILITFHSLKLGLGRVNNFGPGFIFFLTGIALGILSVILFVSALKQNGWEQSEGQERVFKNVHWPKKIGVIFSLIIYAVIYEKMGFLISTFMFIGFLLYSIEGKKWYVVVGVAFATSLLTYVFFAVLLQTRLPKGILQI